MGNSLGITQITPKDTNHVANLLGVTQTIKKSAWCSSNHTPSWLKPSPPKFCIIVLHFLHTSIRQPPPTTRTVHDACNHSRASQKNTAHADCNDCCNLQLPVPVKKPYSHLHSHRQNFHFGDLAWPSTASFGNTANAYYYISWPSRLATRAVAPPLHSGYLCRRATYDVPLDCRPQH